MEKNPKYQGKFSKESGLRLKEVREALDLKPQDFAAAIGVLPQKLADMERGKVRVPEEIALFLDGKYSISFKWLMAGVGPMKSAETEVAPILGEFSYIPMVEAQLSGGNGSFIVSEEIKEYCAFRTEWLFNSLGSPKGKYLLSVAGDSMSPTIQNGDTVMLDTTATHIFDGNIYALRMDDTILIKRLALRPGEKVLVISDNREEYEPYEAARKDIHVLGRIVWFARTLVKSD